MNRIDVIRAKLDKPGMQGWSTNDITYLLLEISILRSLCRDGVRIVREPGSPEHHENWIKRVEERCDKVD